MNVCWKDDASARHEVSQIQKQEMSEQEKNALIATWFHVGEEVRVRVSCKTVTVLEFGKRYIGRGGRTHKLAGVYIDFMNVLVAGETASGKSCYTISAEHLDRLHFSDPVSFQYNDQFPKMRDLNIRIGDLPDTSFWVGDIVKKDVEGRPETFSAGIIAIVNYDYTPASYRVTTGLNTPSQTEFWSDDYLTLVERGNIWKLEHDEPLSFSGDTEAKRLDEEAAFYKSLGMSQKVIFTDTESELWPIGGGLRELQEGRADRIYFKNSGQYAVLIKYDKEEFGNRMRAAELKRLGLEARSVPRGVCMEE